MEEFKAEVDLFKEETPLGVFAGVEKKIDSEVPDGFRKFISKHKFSKDSFLKEVERVRVELKNEYRFEDCALNLHDALPGCIEIVWLIPTSATQHVLQVTSTLERGRFRTVMMVKLEFQGECIYEDDLTSEVCDCTCMASYPAYAGGVENTWWLAIPPPLTNMALALGLYTPLPTCPGYKAGTPPWPGHEASTTMASTVKSPHLMPNSSIKAKMLFAMQELFENC